MKRIFISLLCILSLYPVLSQTTGTIWDAIDGSVHFTKDATTHQKTFTSAIVGQADAEKKMLIMNFEPFYLFALERYGGIIADVSSGSKVTLSVYAYDGSTAGGQKGALIYRLNSTATSTLYTGQPEDAKATLLKKEQTVKSDQIWLLAHSAKVITYSNDPAACKPVLQDWFRSFFRLKAGNYFGNQQGCLPENEFKTKQPVVVELTINGSATVKKVKIPGMGELIPVEIFKPNYIGNQVLAQNADMTVTYGPTTEQAPVINYNLTCDLVNKNTFPVTIKELKAVITRKDNRPNYEDITGTIYDAGFQLPANLNSNETKYFESNGYVSNRFYYNQTDPAVTSAFLQYVYNINDEPDTYVRVLVPVTFKRQLAADQQDVYKIDKTTFSGIPIFKLSGGMSAEYAVQKSLSELSAGISHTWAVRKVLQNPDDPNSGIPDKKGGGPVSVYATPDFLSKSIAETIKYYDDNLGANTPFKKVIIGTGVPCIPYLSFVMKAPFLPVHFLVAQKSLAEVRMVVNRSNEKGYKAYATAGYDPSIPEEGVAWIKLLDLPQEYRDFLSRHQVESVVFVGQDQAGGGETLAARVISKESFNGDAYAPGSIYLMQHSKNELISRYADLDKYLMEATRNIADWESGIAEDAVTAFSKSIAGMENAPEVLYIKSKENIQLYNLATLMALQSWKKNGPPPSGIKKVAINEYLIGYPAAESWLGQVPFLYWQGVPSNYITERVTDNFLRPRAKSYSYFDNIDFSSDLEYHFNAKYDRTPLVDSFKAAGLTNVTMDGWQKMDIWDPNDEGLNAPCERLAVAIAGAGYTAYKQWVDELKPLDWTDLEEMMDKSRQNPEVRDKAATHPDPSTTSTLASGDGFAIKQYDFAADPAKPYWQKGEYSHEINLFKYESEGKFNWKGWLDGSGISKLGAIRSQRVIINELNIDNGSDEYDLRVAYKFNPLGEDDFRSYNMHNGEEQEMNCFPYTLVPRNRWMDIPSRMMERKGAIWIVNGSVYDFDYNGVPGVVPFIKKNHVVKARPQILSFKAEGVFTWNWGTTKQVKILPRPKEIEPPGLGAKINNIFNDETSGYANALAGMTYMSGPNLYDIITYQPGWMLNYPQFPLAYTDVSNTQVRCILSDPVYGTCQGYIQKYGMAPPEEGWNQCDHFHDDEYVKRYSALAYRQYDNSFDFVPNGRTFVAKKGNQLDIGVVDGEFGPDDPKLSVYFTKRTGMENWELSNFARYKKYDALINMDGGSSSMMWYNGRGPLHDWTGYPLRNDNQGPYYSRLVSSFIMLVPKFHSENILSYSAQNKKYKLLDNSGITFDYNEQSDHTKNKSFISLGPSLPLLDKLSAPGLLGQNKFDKKDLDYGAVAGNFAVTNTNSAEGAILYYVGEDMYYEDTQGERLVVPKLRNLLVIGVGKMPRMLADNLYNMTEAWEQGTTNDTYKNALAQNNQAFYFIRVYNSKAVQFQFYEAVPSRHFIDGAWHSFMLRWQRNADVPVFALLVDNETLGTQTGARYTYKGNLSNEPDIHATHAAIGTANVDGRFITGNATLAIDNYLFVTGKEGLDNIYGNLPTIGTSLAETHTLPPLSAEGSIADGSLYYLPGIYALQFEESGGSHSFSAFNNPYDEMEKQTTLLLPNKRLYGLNLNIRSVDYGSFKRDSTVADTTVAGMKVAAPVEETAKAINVYPNPTTGLLYVHLSLDHNDKVSFEVTDYLGRQVYTQQKDITKGKQFITLNLASIKTNGTYILRVRNGSGTVQNSKVFVLSR